MDISKLSWFNTASQRLDWLEQRQRVVAENMANANTPNYVARDVEPFESYLGSRRSASGDVRIDDVQSSWSGSMDGNSVVLEEQAIMAAGIEGKHRLAARLYGKGHEMISLAVGGK